MELNHNQIAPILDFSYEITQKKDKPYFVTKQYLGNTLTQQAPLQPLEALAIFIKICDAVSYAHSKGIVHRDLKPDNIILDSDGNPIILDFGICYFLDEENNRLTETMEQVGSRYYIAPELEDGRSSLVTEAVDTYALGKILYFLLTNNIFARENYKGSNDLSKLLNNPQLDYITQRILDKSVVNSPEQRISVEDLRKEAIKIHRLLNEHFYPNRVGSQCRFCGEGNYQSLILDGVNVWHYIQENSLLSIPKDSRIKCNAVACDNCGNIQLFKVAD
ncbi:serine/threonine-protein kinase [Pseudanabaena minima]|uniref:serine/threonine-protein kinase n=1 Tax=Pseudanabaena minima TaxID=890415 RepID=UPI003DA94F49